MNPEESIRRAVAEFRHYWNAISNIEKSEFNGDWNDILLLAYAVYEGFGAAPDSDDYFLESAVFANCLITHGFEVRLVCREQTKIIIAPSQPYSGYSVNVMSRVQDALSRFSPQFDKYERLMSEILSELIIYTMSPELYKGLIGEFSLEQDIRDRCRQTLDFLNGNEA